MFIICTQWRLLITHRFNLEQEIKSLRILLHLACFFLSYSTYDDYQMKETLLLFLVTRNNRSQFRSNINKILYLLFLAFDRVSYAIRQLGNMTQQSRAAFQYATLNVFQMSSRQQQNQPSSSNIIQSSNAIALAQLQAMQQQKSSSSIHRIGGSIRTTP